MFIYGYLFPMIADVVLFSIVCICNFVIYIFIHHIW